MGFTLLGSLDPSYSNPLMPSGRTLLGDALANPAPFRPMWAYVIGRFSRLLGNLEITPTQKEDGDASQAGIRSCLNRAYWNIASETANSLLIGSWGKETRVRPSRDIDILFLLPPDVYHRYQARSGNRQSGLLQEVKGVLSESYRQTTMRGDGQVVLVPFKSIPIELAIGFRCNDGSIIVCDTNNGGRYVASTAEAEETSLRVSDLNFKGNTRALISMMKQWQRECNVPIKSFQIERLAVEFMQIWAHQNQSLFYYDWMIRDFMAHMINRANGLLIMPGTGEVVMLGAEWLSRTWSAYRAAITACEHERDNYGALAGDSWQKIFGAAIPVLA